MKNPQDKIKRLDTGEIFSQPEKMATENSQSETQGENTMNKTQ